MNVNDIKAGIRKSWGYLKHCEVGLVFSNPAPLVASDLFKAIALSDVATYEEIYLTGLREGQYNIALFDYSFVQFGGADENSLRYAYYPNPFLGSSTDAVSELAELRTYVEDGTILVEDFLHLVADLRSSQHPPLLRYENSFDQYIDLQHPCSHLHFGHHAENRWPLQRIVSPQAFTLLVIKQFYPRFWEDCGMMKVGQDDRTFDELMVLERQDSRVLPDEFFSEVATRQFYIS
ncbi:DUF2290 domain-containing protein [soil metagenome]